MSMKQALTNEIYLQTWPKYRESTVSKQNENAELHFINVAKPYRLHKNAIIIIAESSVMIFMHERNHYSQFPYS